jgi:iron complex outermembrane receptor protein
MHCKRMLSAAIAATLMMSTHSWAQDATATNQAQQNDSSQRTTQNTNDKQAQTLTAVTVTGYRASLEKSLDIKRNADSIVDAITAEDVGKFPDNNVAESLSHLPGVTVDRTFGEGERVSILGTDPALNRLLLNGQTLASTNWAGDPDNPDSRSFDYTMLSPQIIGTAEVYKTPQARIDEGSIGGTVIVNTRRPLDLKANTLTGTVSYGYNSNAERGKPNASVLYSWKNANDTFGILGTLMHDDRVVDRYGTEIFGYQQFNDPADASARPGGNHYFPPSQVSPDAHGTYPTSANTAWFQQQRKRNGVQTGIEWKPNKNFDLNFTGLYSQDNLNNYNQSRYAYWGDNAQDTLSIGPDNGLATSGSYGAGAPTHLDGYYRNTKIKTESFHLRADWYGEGWDASGQIGYTQSRGGSDGIYFLSFKTLAPYNWTLNGHGPLINYDVPGTDASAANLDADGLNYAPSYDRERYAQLDFSHDLNLGPFTQIQAGVKATNHANGQNDYNSNLPSIQDPNPADQLTLAQFAGGSTPGNFLSGLPATPTMRDWTTISSGAIQSYVSGLPGANDLSFVPSGSYSIQEHTRAAYVQGNFSGGAYRGNVGVRYVYTRDIVDGYTYMGSGNLYAPLSVAHSYHDWLPSFNFTYNITDDLLWRFAAAKVIARPRFQNMTPYVATQDISLTASGGNPDLKPYKSTNFDSSLEYYFTPKSILSAELFFRKISQYILYQTVLEPLYNNTLHETSLYQTTLPINASNAKVKGLSLTYQGDIWGGFGVYANYTYSQADTVNGYNLPYNSKNAYNITPYYEQGPWTIRVNLGWRSPYFTQIGSIGAKQMADAYTELDASVAYRINDHLQVAFNATNLLNETYYAYDNTPNTPLNTYKNGRSYMMSLNFKL